MWPLIKSFLLDAAIARAFWRVVFASLGAAAAAGQIPWAAGYEWVGYVLVAATAASTGKKIPDQIRDMKNGGTR